MKTNPNRQKKKIAGLIFLLLLAITNLHAQEITWQNPPSLNKPINILTEEGIIDLDFYAQVAAIADAKVEITLPTHVSYVSNSAVTATGHAAGNISAVASGQKVTITFASGSLPVETRVHLQLKVTVGNCAFTSADATIAILSGTTPITTGGNRTLAIVGQTPDIMLTTDVSVVNLTTPGPGTSPATDKADFELKISVANGSAKSLRIIFSSEDQYVFMENFKLDNVSVSATSSGTAPKTYTVTLTNETFTGTPRLLTFTAYSDRTKPRTITTRYRYLASATSDAAACVSGPGASFTLNYPTAPGFVNFAAPTDVGFSMTQDGPLLSGYDVPCDGQTRVWNRRTYQNTGAAGAIAVMNEMQLFRNYTGHYSYMDPSANIQYSINGGIKKNALVTVRGTLANDKVRTLKPEVVGKTNHVYAYLDNDTVPSGGTVTFYYPVIQGLIYDNTLIKQNTDDPNPLPSFYWFRHYISSTNTNGDVGGAPTNLELSGSGSIGTMPLFQSAPAATSIRKGTSGQTSASLRTPSANAPAYTKPQTLDLYVKLPAWLELDYTTNITEALVFGTGTGNYSLSSTHDHVNKIYSVKVAVNNVIDDLKVKYKTVAGLPDTQNRTDTIEYWMDWNMGTNSANATVQAYRPTLPRFGQVFQPITLLAEEDGLILNSFDFQRTTKGLKDSNNNSVPDNGDIAPDGEIDHSLYLAYDQGKMIIKGKLANNVNPSDKLYILLNSEVAFGGTDMVLGNAELKIGATTHSGLSLVVSGMQSYLTYTGGGLTPGANIELTIPFTFGSTGQNVKKGITIEGYTSAKTAAQLGDVFNPATADRHGKDIISNGYTVYALAISTSASASINANFPDNNTVTGIILPYIQIYENNNFRAPYFDKEVRQIAKPTQYVLEIPEGYILEDNDSLRIYANGVLDAHAQANRNRKVPLQRQEAIVSGGTRYFYDLSAIYVPDHDETKAALPNNKWMYSDDWFYHQYFVDIRATKAVAPIETMRGRAHYISTQQNATISGTTTFTARYTGDYTTLALSTSTLYAYSQRLSIPTVAVGNPNDKTMNMWLYVAGNAGKLSVTRGASTISGTGTEGRWLNLGGLAKGSYDYRLSFDYLGGSNCAGDTLTIYTVSDFDEGPFTPPAVFNPKDYDHVGAYKRVIIRSASATVSGGLDVSNATLTYNQPYNLLATIDASASPGALKDAKMSITIPAGQQYTGVTANLSYPEKQPNGTVITRNKDVRSLVNSALSGADPASERTFTFDVEALMQDPNFALEGFLADNADPDKQKAVLNIEFKPMCNTPLSGIRYRGSVSGKTFCGQTAVGNGRLFNSPILLPNIQNINYGFEVAISSKSGNRSFNEVLVRDTLQVTVMKNKGRYDNISGTDQFALVLPKSMNVESGIKMISSDLGIASTALTVGSGNNTINGNSRTVLLTLPVTEINTDTDNGYEKTISYTIPVVYIPDGQTLASTPEQIIDAQVLSRAAFDNACAPAAVAVGSNSLEIALITTNTNPAAACLDTPLDLEITSDGFDGAWYSQSNLAPISELSSNPEYIYTPTVQANATFYVSAIINGNDYGVVPVNVTINPVIVASFTATPNYGTGKINITNNSTLNGASNPTTGVIWRWVDTDSPATTLSTAFNPTDINIPIKASGIFNLVLIATTTEGCISTDTVRMEVNTMVDITVFLQGPMTGTRTMTNAIQQSGNSGHATLKLPTTDPYGLATTCADINTTAVVGAVVDWVRVEIRKVSTPSVVEEAKALLLRPDGKIVNLDGNTPGFTPRTEPVYIVVKHRNHLSVASTAIPTFTGNISHDFSTGSNKALAYNSGNIPMIQSNNTWCMWAGDINGNGRINSEDLNIAFSPINNIERDNYINVDVTLNGRADSSDMNIILSPINNMTTSPVFAW